jgi:uncharacterized protein (TIGR02246 family)
MDTMPALSHSGVIALYTQLLTFWNQRNPNAFAALFADTGCCIGFDGSQMNGPDEIGSTLQTIFAHPAPASYGATVRLVQQRDQHVAQLLAAVGMVPPDQREINPAVNAIQSLVVEWVLGEPKIILFQNTPAAFHGRPELVGQQTAELASVLLAGKVVDAS